MSKECIIERRVSQCDNYRPVYHFTPPQGWMNDPNGLIYFKNKYHLFYQYNPYSCNWSSMHWGHAISDDLLHWEDCPIALYPDKDYDNDPEGGCFSGSALEKDGKLYLFYTGSVKREGKLYQTQNLVISEDGMEFHKYEKNPIIVAPPQNASADFRDPKVYAYEGNYYMVVGGCIGDTDAGDGRIFLYKSKDLFEWKYQGVLVSSEHKLGTMFECPDMFRLKDKWIITTSPMRNPDNNKALYFVGTMDFEKCCYHIEHTGCLDYGYDYYAPQSFEDKNGNRIMIAWMNGWLWMPWCKDFGPTAVEGWRGAFSVPRKISLDKENRILSEPLENIFQCGRKIYVEKHMQVGTEPKSFDTQGQRSYILQFKVNPSECQKKILELELLMDEYYKTCLQIDFIKEILVLDRDEADGYQTGRVVCNFEAMDEETELTILVDNSSIEIFWMNGKYCISNNIYSKKGQTGLTMKVSSGNIVASEFCLAIL